MANEPRGGTAQRTEWNLAPGVETMVVVRALPKSTCYLHHVQAGEQIFQLEADDLGVVRFHVTAPPGGRTTELRLECHGEHGERHDHAVVLSCDPHAMPTVAPEAEKIGRRRPALTGDPLAVSPEELARGGYPERPDPAKSPVRYANWLRQVSSEFTVVEPRLAPRPRRPGVQKAFTPGEPPSGGVSGDINQTSAANSGIWSGAYLTRPNGSFTAIMADWIVPAVVYLVGAPTEADAVIWVGLDNAATDLYQSGSHAVTYVWFDETVDSDRQVFYTPWSFANYWMWIECLPWTEYAIPNFPVSPGDLVHVSMFVAEGDGSIAFSEGRITGQDNYMWFIVTNLSQLTVYEGLYPRGAVSFDGQANTGFTGSTAEFILERPGLTNGATQPLAPFGAAIMNNCYYGDADRDDDWVGLAPIGGDPPNGSLNYYTMVGTDIFGDPLLAASVITVPVPQAAQLIWQWHSYGGAYFAAEPPAP
jgi:hypothetical protein